MPASNAILDRPGFRTPTDPHIKIWRYINFAKYVAFLETSALYFSRVDRFKDPWEGAISPANIELLRSMIDTSGLPGGFDQWKKGYLAQQEQQRKWIYVNSWHMNEVESAAMWELYGQRNEAIAIQSTYEKLANSLPAEVENLGQFSPEDNTAELEFFSPQILVGEVQYVDYVQEAIPELSVATTSMYKRASFEHERELRAVIAGLPPATKASPTGELGVARYDLKNLEMGRLVKVSVESLVEKVVVAPQAEAWFRELVEKVSVKYGVNEQRIDRSSLYDKPVY